SVMELDANYEKSLGEVYQKLFTALVKLRPSFINLLVEAGMEGDDENNEWGDKTPSWVPNWSTVRRRSWLLPAYIYDPINKDYKPKMNANWDDSGREMTIQGA